MAAESLADRLDRRIRDAGPIAVSEYVEAALYDEAGGFYTTGGRAGRRGDFLTAPEVGPLFGAVLAEALDGWWVELGRPEPFTVIDWGAGPGTLARSVLAAEPEVVRAGALAWWAVERSAAQRELHPVHDLVTSGPRPPEGQLDGVIVANELLDNLPFDIAEWDGAAWRPVLVGPRDADGRFGEVLGAPDPGLTERLGHGERSGHRVPVEVAARDWVADALGRIRRGRLVVFDYGGSTADLARRDGGWLRTHAGHDGGSDWRRNPGSCDITVDVAWDQLTPVGDPSSVVTQADWLRRHGIDALVEEGRRAWEDRAGVGDLAALRARSRIREAEALCDPDGMGGFGVLEVAVGGAGTPPGAVV